MIQPSVKKFIQEVKNLRRTWRLKNGELRTHDDFRLCPIAALWAKKKNEPNPTSRLNWRFNYLALEIGLSQEEASEIVFASDGDPPSTPASDGVRELRAELIKELNPQILNSREGD